MTFARRRIDVTITLGTGTFGDTIGDTITLTGHRVIAEVVAYGGDTQGQLQASIFGIPQSVMNQLTAVGPTNSVRGKNRITVAAGDDGDALSTIYVGTIDQAYGNYQSIPEVPLQVTALSALAAAMKPVGASSYPGSVDVATIMSDLADVMGVGFENFGVSVILSNPYLPGTAYDQVRAAAKAADIYFTIDRDVLSIWPKDGSRDGDSDPPLISPDTGLVGYPVFSSAGIGVTSLFNPSIRYGSPFDVQSSIPAACGLWNTYAFVHNLESERAGGPWFTHISGYRGPSI